MDFAKESVKKERPNREIIWRAKSALIVAVLTTLTLTGSVMLAFLGIDLNGNLLRNSNDITRIVVGITALVLSLLLGGLLWGAGIAWWTGKDVPSLAKAGAKGWTGMAFLFAVLLEVVNGFQTLIGRALRLSPHALLTVSFTVAVILVVWVAVRSLWARLDTPLSTNRVASACAGAAAVGYIIFDWYMQQQGWVLGSYHGIGVSVMVSVMRVGLTGAGLGGGATLGWFLGDSKKWTSVDI